MGDAADKLPAFTAKAIQPPTVSYALLSNKFSGCRECVERPFPFAQAEQRDYVIVTVTDTGTGMSEDVIEKMFKPFFTTKPVGQRAGLGRSMLSLPTTRCRSGFLHG